MLDSDHRPPLDRATSFKAGARSAGSPLPASADRKYPTLGFRKGMAGFQLAYEQFPVNELAELGVTLEQAGFDVMTHSDHLQPWQANQGHSGQAWLTMSSIGGRTKRIVMGTTVTCPSFRYNPAVVAEAFASLSILYPGRIFLGIGSGEALNEQAATGTWPGWLERSERLIEAQEVMEALWSGQQVIHKGKYYDVNMRLYDTPASKIPILMAGNGPKAMRRVGVHGQGLITDPKTWKEHRTKFESGAKESGKDPSRMPVFLEQMVVVGDRKDAERAAELWRFLPKAWQPYFNIRDPREIQNLAEKELSLDQVCADWVISTDPDQHVQKLQEAFLGGATEVHIHSGQPDQRKVIEFYGNEVLPRLRKSAQKGVA
ncbi:MAG TPA: TIGR03557 family F420-dependent LLM class oxidoreductase [Terriglobales bacterium]|nr:TIGR03557 family F420-dependent LLM class oxidoreductase [Terriglobales bacterium]